MPRRTSACLCFNGLIFSHLSVFLFIQKNYSPKQNIPSDNPINFSLALVLLI